MVDLYYCACMVTNPVCCTLLGNFTMHPSSVSIMFYYDYFTPSSFPVNPWLYTLSLILSRYLLYQKTKNGNFFIILLPLHKPTCFTFTLSFFSLVLIDTTPRSNGSLSVLNLTSSCLQRKHVHLLSPLSICPFPLAFKYAQVSALSFFVIVPLLLY